MPALLKTTGKQLSVTSVNIPGLLTIKIKIRTIIKITIKIYKKLILMKSLIKGKKKNRIDSKKSYKIFIT